MHELLEFCYLQSVQLPNWHSFLDLKPVSQLVSLEVDFLLTILCKLLCIFSRIIVGSEFIGAIIGRQGQTIHNITQQSKAR